MHINTNPQTKESQKHTWEHIRTRKSNWIKETINNTSKNTETNSHIKKKNMHTEKDRKINLHTYMYIYEYKMIDTDIDIETHK